MKWLIRAADLEPCAGFDGNARRNFLAVDLRSESEDRVSSVKTLGVPLFHDLTVDLIFDIVDAERVSERFCDGCLHPSCVQAELSSQLIAGLEKLMTAVFPSIRTPVR